MSPVYLNGIPPTYNVSTLVAAANVQTPYLQGSAAAGLITVPPVATPETMVLFTAVQTLSSKTLLQPVITSGVLTLPILYSADIRIPVTTGGTITSATINTSVLNTPTVKMTGGGVLTGGIMHDTVRGTVPLKTQAVGATKTLDFSTADVFVVDLTQACTLTIANAAASKLYNVIIRQTATAALGMSWMTGFVCNAWASGPSPKSGAVDVWQVLYESVTGNHYAISNAREVI